MTILLGLAGLAAHASSSTPVLPHGARYVVAAAVIALVLSSLSAVLPALPQVILVANVQDVQKAVRDLARQPARIATTRILQTRLRQVEDERRVNRHKAWGLAAAIALQSVAVALVAVATVWTVIVG
ncbi:hypothetical protein KDK95_25610 [Actinospica sp. MGRD01-02]|uniref:Uncharacterized protein n=1 Tax=Actinospica acidithermotolerans TaxID=2828514 RepID=A0A941IJQ0_9ACTN|nr:hypothetical protein [Actinospica acidithermotolerans]MBR7829709.1 hypothetical protein [Actinospica acidithermotolerans]